MFRDPLNPLSAPPPRYKYHAAADSSGSESDQSDEEGAGFYPDSQSTTRYSSGRRPEWRRDDVRVIKDHREASAQKTQFESIRVIVFVGDVGQIWKRAATPNDDKSTPTVSGSIELVRKAAEESATRQVLRWSILPPSAHSDDDAELIVHTVDRITTGAIAFVSQAISNLAASFASKPSTNIHFIVLDAYLPPTFIPSSSESKPSRIASDNPPIRYLKTPNAGELTLPNDAMPSRRATGLGDWPSPNYVLGLAAAIGGLATRSNLPLHVLLLPRPLSPHDLGMALQVVVVSKRSTTTTAVPLLSQSVRNQFDAKKIEWDDEVDSMERRRSGMQGGYRRIPAPIGDGGMYI